MKIVRLQKLKIIRNTINNNTHQGSLPNVLISNKQKSFKKSENIKYEIFLILST